MLDTYRLNQSETFNHLLAQSKSIVPGDFFMTVDVDEFYGDGVAKRLSNVRELQAFDFLTFREIVLTDPVGRIAPLYSSESIRRWNIPIKFTGNEFFMFTRGVWRFWKKKNGIHMKPVPDLLNPGAYLGEVFHCKYRFSTDRHEVGYKFGDRRAPSSEERMTVTYLPDIPKGVPT